MNEENNNLTLFICYNSVEQYEVVKRELENIGHGVTDESEKADIIVFVVNRFYDCDVFNEMKIYKEAMKMRLPIFIFIKMPVVVCKDIVSGDNNYKSSSNKIELINEIMDNADGLYVKVSIFEHIDVAIEVLKEQLSVLLKLLLSVEKENK